MSRGADDEEAALGRMLAADEAKEDRSSASWDEWQRAATDYWVIRHPNLRELRRGEPARTPTIAAFEQRAEAIRVALADIPRDWRLRPPSRRKVEHLARVGWWHELLAGLYEPVEWAIARLHDGDQSGLETLIRYLEADVYCFRSGYVKADVIRTLTRASLDAAETDRLRAVVLAVVDTYDRREFRAYIRLARRIDSPALRAALQERLTSPDPRTARHAAWMLAGLGSP